MIDSNVSDSTKKELFEAIEEHNIEKFRHLLKDLNEMQLMRKEFSLGGDSLLSFADKNGNIKVVQELFKIKVIYDSVVKNNDALRWAAKKGHLVVVQELLKIEAVRDNAAVNNNYVLGCAAQKGHLEVVQELLKIEAVRDNAAVNNNYALRSAAREGHLEVVQELLKIEAVRDNAAVGNNEALRCAASNAHFGIVQELIKMRAVRENAATEDNYALGCAASKGHLEVVQELLKIEAVRDNAAVSNNYALRSAAPEGHLEVLQELLKIEAVRDNAAVNNNEALRWAAKKGHLVVVQELLKIEAIRNNAAVSNNQALRWAAKKRHLGVLQELLTIEAVRVNAAAMDNEALFFAAKKGHLNVLQELLKIETVRNNAAINNNKALRNAVAKGHLDVVEELLKIEIVRDNGAINNNKALRIAATKGHLAIVKELLKIEDVRDNAAVNNNAVLRQAIGNGYHEIVKMLMSVSTVSDCLLQNGAKQLTQILGIKPLDDTEFDAIFSTLMLYGVSLSQIIDRNSQTILEDIKFYCTHPESYLEQKSNLSLSQRQAVRIVKSYQDVLDYEEIQREEQQAMEQWQNPDDEKKIAGVMNHFKQVIQPHFLPIFESRGDTLEERLQSIESDIRALLLYRMKEGSLEQIKKGAAEGHSTIQFIEKNFEALKLGKDKDLMKEARERHFNSNAINEHVAWRVYDKWAPCVKEWPNLLTPPLVNDNEKVYSVDVLGETNANAASLVIRELVAISFCLVMDWTIDNAATKPDRIENFIGQLKDIRRAHNDDDSGMDNPSCYPGTVSRAGLMWAMHSLALSRGPLELLPDVLKTKVASTFNIALEQSSDQAQRDVLYYALVMLRKENALDVITEKADFSHEPDWALMRQAFIDSLGTYSQLWDEVNKELEAIGVENTLAPDQQVYLLQYLADIGGGWSAEALTSIYRQHDDKMEIEEVIITDEKEEKIILTNPYCTFKGMPEKMAQMRAKQYAAWEIISPLLEDHSDNATGELNELAKIIVKGWVESENKLSESLGLSTFWQEDSEIINNNKKLIEIVSSAYHVANTKHEEIAVAATMTAAYDNQKKRSPRPDDQEESDAKRPKNDDDIDEPSEYRSARRL